MSVLTPKVPKPSPKSLSARDLVYTTPCVLTAFNLHPILLRPISPKPPKSNPKSTFFDFGQNFGEIFGFDLVGSGDQILIGDWFRDLRVPLLGSLLIAFWTASHASDSHWSQLSLVNYPKTPKTTYPPKGWGSVEAIVLSHL